MERIILGSADVFIQAFDGSTVPVTADICKPENLMAYISGGASVEYKPSFYTAKDDTGKKSKTIVTEEEVTLKTGIMTFDGNKFKYLCDTARVTEDKAKKRRTVKIGGYRQQTGRALCYLPSPQRRSGRRYLGNDRRKQSGRLYNFFRERQRNRCGRRDHGPSYGRRRNPSYVRRGNDRERSSSSIKAKP